MLDSSSTDHNAHQDTTAEKSLDNFTRDFFDTLQADDLPEWNIALCGTILVLLPPVLVVLFMQRWFVKGLIEKEK